jgi:hypothetical protein
LEVGREQHEKRKLSASRLLDETNDRRAGQHQNKKRTKMLKEKICGGPFCEMA